jgi:glycosyltransferase involved in cell wall biosynthesis
MKSKKRNVKKIIKKRIELQQTKMGIRDKIRISRTPPRPMPVDLVSRSEIRSNIVVIGKKTLPLPEERKPISIIITAYKSEEFIEETLDSIENQTYFINNDNFEVLIGVDACEETLKKIQKIRNKYRNISVIMMNNNVGTYVTTNTLLDLVKYNNILRFDSDDIMLPKMIEEISFYISKCNVIRIKCGDFIVINNKKKYSGFERIAAGVIFYKKNFFLKLGGYQPWVCAADSELIKRMGKNFVISNINEVLFDRRVHDNNLSNTKKTGINSELRKAYHKIIGEIKLGDEIYVKKITGTYKIIESENNNDEQKNNIDSNFSI